MAATLVGLSESARPSGWLLPYVFGDDCESSRITATCSSPFRQCAQRWTCTTVEILSFLNLFNCMTERGCVAGIDVTNEHSDDDRDCESVLLSSTVPTASPSRLDDLLAGAAQAALLGSVPIFLFSGGPAGVAMSCLPLWPFLADEDAASFRGGPGSSTIRRSFMIACLGQATVAAFQFSLGDAAAGVINFGISSIGLQASTPNGHRLLQSYTVLAFCTGTMQVLLGAESVVNPSTILYSAAPVAVKLTHLLALASPALSFLGLALAYQLYKEVGTFGVTIVISPGTGSENAPGTTDDDAHITGFRPFAGHAHRL